MTIGQLSLRFSIAFFLVCSNAKAEQLITFFIRPYPSFTSPEKASRVKGKLHHPSRLARQQLKHILSNTHIISGIFATYAGFLTVSDLNGQVRFPRKHSAPQAYFLIAERITPIVRSGNTLSHWEINTDFSAAMYSIKKISDAPSALTFFEINEVPLPKDNVVPLEAVVIFAKPKYIYVPVGRTMSKESPHLIIPDIYAKKGISLADEALYVLNTMQYYGTLTFIVKKQPRRYSTHLLY